MRGRKGERTGTGLFRAATGAGLSVCFYLSFDDCATAFGVVKARTSGIDPQSPEQPSGIFAWVSPDGADYALYHGVGSIFIETVSRRRHF